MTCEVPALRRSKVAACVALAPWLFLATACGSDATSAEGSGAAGAPDAARSSNGGSGGADGEHAPDAGPRMRDAGAPPDGGIAENGGSAGAGGTASSGGSVGIGGTGGAASSSGGAGGASAGAGGDVNGSGGKVGAGGDVSGAGGKVGAGGDVSASGGNVGAGGDVNGSGGNVGTAGAGGSPGSGGAFGGSGGAVDAGGSSSGGIGGTPGAGGAVGGCGGGQKLCGGGCVSIDDPAYGCSPSGCAPCVLPNATASCGAQGCAIGQCASTYADCDGVAANGCERSIGGSDANNCGGCGTRCSATHVLPMCTDGVCDGPCAVGYTDCDGDKQSNGCESATSADPQNCGGCGLACSTNHVTPACHSGVCAGTCSPGYTDCNGDKRSDGCETAISTDVANCGGCGVTCSANHVPSPACTGGTCTGACATGYADCNGDKRSDGCETAISTDIANCGGCGLACSANHVTPDCANGVCDGACAAGYVDCNGNEQIDGCEVNVANDPSNCGQCGAACSTNHVAASCAAGACNGACAAGYADCDSDKRTNGCETATLSDPSNCGGCGAACSANHVTVACSAGTCSGACAYGYADCNGDKRTDGCETATNTDVANCGGCGVACSANHMNAVSCDNGVCDGACAPGYSDCNGDKQGDGCETPGPCTPPKSCLAGGDGLSNCGPNADEDCCTSITVPGGTFYRSYDGTTPFTSKAYPATISKFRLDKYEVTVGRFRQFVQALIAGWTPTVGSGKHSHLNGGAGLADSYAAGTYEPGFTAGAATALYNTAAQWNAALACSPEYTWTKSVPVAPNPTNERRPINCINWYQAYGFCVWDGGFLPSEAEWNYVAAGGSEQRYRAWSVPPSSQTIDTSYASYWVDAVQQCMGDGVAGCTFQDLIYVGTKPNGNGKWGHADLMGNVEEWVLDEYPSSVSLYAGYTPTCTDCFYLSPTGGINARVTRGGNFAQDTSWLLASVRNEESPSSGNNGFVGVRCARAP
jgi:formylglycine-generating enzyme required for sulfatase activity